MKNLIYVILFLLFILLLACTPQRDGQESSASTDSVAAASLPAPVMMSTNPGVTMTIENIDSLKIPVDSIVVKFTNNTNEWISYGTYFEVEREENGRWEKIHRNPGDTSELLVVYLSIGYLVEPDSSSVYTNPTKFINRAFTPGKYRLTKTYFVGESHQNDTARVIFHIQ